MSVSEIQIIPIQARDGLVAFANLVIDEKLYVSSIGVHTKLSGGYRITYPTKKVGDRSIQLFHPITRELGREIEEEVIAKMKNVMTHADDRHDRYDTAAG